jgi:glutathione S-transferase
MADLLAGAYVDRWMRLDAEASSLAHIARYFERLLQREPYKKTILAFEVKPAQRQPPWVEPCRLQGLPE